MKIVGWADAVAHLAERGKDVSRYFTNLGEMMAPSAKGAAASGVDKYIAKAPKEVQGRLKQIG